jgi:hypothetical protein
MSSPDLRKPPRAARAGLLAGVGLLAVSLVIRPSPVAADQTLRCESHRYRYEYCPADTDNRVELIHQFSSVDCRQGSSWGYDPHGVWVDHGCSADFRVGRSGNRNRDKAIVAGVALAGLAAVIAMSSQQKQAAQDVSAWAVGSFAGQDTMEGVEVQLTILPGGSVNGRAGSNTFTGRFAGNRLEAGRHVFRVDRSGNGFVAVDERDPGHRVNFQRRGSGY